MNQSTNTPTLTPPAAGLRDGNGDGVGASQPVIKDAAAAGVRPAAPQGPVGLPPNAAGTAAAAAAAGPAAADGVAGTWRTGVTIDALWAANETRNAWMRVVGLGWKKLYNGRDGAFTALTILAAQARQAGRPVNYREEADGMVYEIYLW